MKATDFKNLLQGTRELQATRAGKKLSGTRRDVITEDSIALLRARLGFSQAQFARALGISVDTLQNWEQGRRQPTGPARVLLRVVRQHPEALLAVAS